MRPYRDSSCRRSDSNVGYPAMVRSTDATGVRPTFVHECSGWNQPTGVPIDPRGCFCLLMIGLRVEEPN